jgi:NADH dehydrogenase/NADH:ubiquinone oxidoreductase subunit G
MIFMKDNKLGIDIAEMVDISEMIDTEVSSVIVQPGTEEVTGDTEPPEKSEAEKNLIEVNIEDEPQEDNSSTETDTIADAKQSSSSLPDLQVLAKALYEQGVLSELDISKLENKDMTEAEMLVDLIKGEINTNVSSYKEGLPQKIKDIIENYEDNVPLDTLIGMESAKIRLDNISEDELKGNVELQKTVIIENFKRTGMSDAKIQKRIQQFSDLDQLQDESIEALADSKEFISTAVEAEKATAKEQTETAEKNRTDSLKSLKEDINSITDLVDGMKLSEKEKTTLYDSMTKAVDKDVNGAPMNRVMVTRAKNPLGFEKLLHYYHSIGLFDTNEEGQLSPDISKIKTGAKASMMDELSSALRTSQSASSGTPARETNVDRSRIKSNIDSMKGLIQ